MDIVEKIKSLAPEERDKFVKMVEKNGYEYGIYPLSKEQYGTWFAYKMDKSKKNSYYNMCFKVEFSNAINYEKVFRSLSEIINGQEVFKYKYFELDEAVYQYIDKQQQLEIEEISFENLPKEEAKSKYKEYEDGFKNKAFDLIKETPIKTALIKTIDKKVVLLVSIHHIISDGWSIGILIRTILALLKGELIEKSEGQYSDYILWQKSEEARNINKTNLEYWKRTLKKDSGNLDLHTKVDRNHMRSGEGAVATIVLEKALVKKIRETIKATQSTTHSLFMTLYYMLLSRYSNKKEINVGVPVANRTQNRFKDTIGFFATTIVVPLKSNNSTTFLQLLGDVKNCLFEGLEHQNITLSEILDSLDLKREKNLNSLFQVVFGVHSRNLLGCDMGEEIDIEGSKSVFKNLNDEKLNNFSMDLALTILEKEEEIEVQLNYSTELFSEERILVLLKVYKNLLTEIVKDYGKNIEEYALITAEEIKGMQDDSIIIDYRPNASEKMFIKDEGLVKFKCHEGYLSVLDENYNIVPFGFEGQIYFNKDNVWYSTGDRGYLNEDRKLVITHALQNIVEFEGEIINLSKLEEELIERFLFQSCKISLHKDEKEENTLIIFYQSKETYLEGVFKSYFNGANVMPLKMINIPLDMNNNINLDKLVEYYGRNIIDTLILIRKRLLDYKKTKNIVISEAEFKTDHKFTILFDTEDGKPIDDNEIKNIRIKNQHVELNFIKELPIYNGQIHQKVLEEVVFKSIYTYTLHEKDDIEDKLFKIWMELLDKDNFTIYDKFYEVGGNSIKSLKLLSKVNKKFNIELNITDLFENSTVYELAYHIKKMFSEDLKDEEITVMKF